jgi:hypothetical protein
MNNFTGNIAREDVATGTAVHRDFHLPPDNAGFGVSNVIDFHSEPRPWCSTWAVFGWPSRMDG